MIPVPADAIARGRVEPVTAEYDGIVHAHEAHFRNAASYITVNVSTGNRLVQVIIRGAYGAYTRSVYMVEETSASSHVTERQDVRRR